MTELRAGDVIAVKNYWGAKSVAVLAGYGETTLLAYECTKDARPTCLRTGREEPAGIQAHRVTDFSSFGPVFHYSLRYLLYPLQIDRILDVVELQLGYGPTIESSRKVWDNRNAELVAEALVSIGVLCSPKLDWTPNGLVKHLVKTGIVSCGKQIN